MECDVCQPSGNIEGAGKTTICNACTETIERHVREVLLREEEEGGYNTNLFVDSPSDQYLCPICLQVHKQPMQVVGCGHVYCMQCLNTATRGQEEKICPFCREGFEFAIKDMSMKRMVMALKIKCKNEGCQWIGDLSNLQPHLEKDCKYLLINCTSDRCEVNVEKSNLIPHLIEECPFLRVKCSLCRIFICSSTKEGTKDCMDEHIKADVSIHLAFSTEEIGRLKQHNIENNQQVKIQELEEKITDLQILNSDLRDKYGRIQVKYADLKATFDKKLDDKNRLLSQKISGLQSKLDKMRNENNKTHEIYDTELDEINQNKFLISNSFKNEFIWVIDGFGKKFKQVIDGDICDIKSPVFVTNRGYSCKLSADIYIADDEDSEDTYLSLYFTLIKGKFDAILPWPFLHKVTISIISQYNVNEDETAVLHHTDHADVKCFKRPDDETGNVGYGCSEFLPHAEMIKSFVKDDAMFIKCQIE